MHLFEGKHITTHPRWPVSAYRHLDFWLQPATGSASPSVATRTCKMESASALRSPSSFCSRVSHCYRLVSNTQSTAFRPMKSKLITFWVLSRTYPTIELYRLARPRTRWYELRGLSLVGSECIFPQCNIPFVITRGNIMPSAMDLPAHVSRARTKPQ